jgi:hypothetical protein
MIEGDPKQVLDFYAQNPLDFFQDILGCQPWSEQTKILNSVRDNPETAVKSCHSLGKDWLSARIAIWFMCCHSPSLVITTAPTDRQVKGILWQEIAMAAANSRIPLGGSLLKQELHLSPDQRAMGFTATDATRFQGWHCPNMLIILDESAAIEQDIYTGIDSCLASGIKTRRLEIGNPTDPTSEFAKSFKTPGITKISVSAFDTPNFTTFGITQKDIVDGSWSSKITDDLPAPWLVTPAWVAKRAQRWGISNPLYLSRVTAQFPVEGENTLISLADIEAAQNRDLEIGEPNILGVDVARFGSDKTVINHRQGPVNRIIESFSKVDTMETVGHTKMAWRKTMATRVHVDVIGVGGGVHDRLNEQHVPVVEANASAAAFDPENFINRRAEWYWNLRSAFETGEIDLDPLDEDLAAELCDIQWKPNSKGKIQIESKEDIKKRVGRSPDNADALAVCYDQDTDFIDMYKKAVAAAG